ERLGIFGAEVEAAEGEGRVADVEGGQAPAGVGLGGVTLEAGLVRPAPLDLGVAFGHPLRGAAHGVEAGVGSVEVPPLGVERGVWSVAAPMARVLTLRVRAGRQGPGLRSSGAGPAPPAEGTRAPAVR